VGRTCFYRAASHGQAAVIQELIKIPEVDVNFCTIEGASPLNIACQQGHVNVVELILADPRVDVNVGNTQGATALFFACQEGHIGVVQLLLNHPATDVNLPTFKKVTPFYIACETGHVDIVQLLLKNPHVDFNAAASDNMTPFISAITMGHLEIVIRILIQGKNFKYVHEFEDESTLELARKESKEMYAVIEDYEKSPERFRRKWRELYEISVEEASEVLILIRLLGEQYLRFEFAPEKNGCVIRNQTIRFFKITLQLPFEIQMLIANYFALRPHDFIKSVHLTKASHKIWAAL